MNPNPYIHVFALIAIVALGFHVFSDFWLPMALGAVAMFLIALMLRR
ncbi:MAG: hypothetical protein KF712_16290 [Akkermansiaceae bacterium]|jgi:hypothetical protein|nr:hypothetical protein [Akkermansiaceae bacterium]